MSQHSPAKKLSDSVRDMNDHARWGRLGDAAQMVDGSYRNAFVAAHQEWGEKIEVADTEVVQLQIAPDAEHANALVSYSWYAIDTMTLHETTIRQRWSAVGSGYALFSEAIVKGDPRLLKAAPPERGSTPDDAVSHRAPTAPPAVAQ